LESASGKTAGKDFGFCINPEFLREGTAITDFYHPPYTVLGQFDERSGDLVSKLYTSVEAPLIRVSLGVAEMIKYASNAFHALKVVFANEIGNVSQMYGVDSHKVMEIFVQDTKLNLSPAYLMPGFAFGGSCLGKDVRALLYAARRQDVSVPLLEAILPSNQLQIQKAIDILIRENKQKIAMIGLSFKPNTDDLRESPAVELAERLLGKGFTLSIYDEEVSLNQITGSNRLFIDQVLPHLSTLICPSLETAITFAEAVVVTKKISDLDGVRLLDLLKPDQVLIDLVRVDEQATELVGNYHGIAW
jgi:GDP-mannose 6-dehydrogenase